MSKQVHPIAFEMLPFDDGRSLRSGVVYAANESRFASTHYSEPLTAYTVGWRDPANLEDLLEFLAPSVPTGRRFEFKRAVNFQEFLSESDDVRAIGSAFKRVEVKGDTVNSKTHNKGLTMRVDHDDEVGDDWRERHTAYLLRRIWRNEVRRAVAILNAAATNVGKTWDSSGTPDVDVRDAIVAAIDVSGVGPNRIAYDEAAWHLRYKSYSVQDNAGAYAQANLTPEQLRGFFGVDDVRVVSARYSSTVSAKSKVMTDKTVLIYSAEGGASKDDPSDIKRFTSNTDQGGKYAVYVEEHPKFTDITVEHYSNITATNGLSGTVRKVTASAT